MVRNKGIESIVRLGIHEGKKKKSPNLCQKSTGRCGTYIHYVYNMYTMWYLYAMENYSAIKKNELLPLVTTW